MDDSTGPYKWSMNLASSISTGQPDLETAVMGETNSLQFVDHKEQDSRGGGEDLELPVNYPLSKATWSEDRMGVVGVLGELVVR